VRTFFGFELRDRFGLAGSSPASSSALTFAAERLFDLTVSALVTAALTSGVCFGVGAIALVLTAPATLLSFCCSLMSLLL
jgi:hypothetical protein